MKLYNNKSSESKKTNQISGSAKLNQNDYLCKNTVKIKAHFYSSMQ